MEGIACNRVFLIVLDSVGIGAAGDAASFGDVGAHTLRSVDTTGKLEIPNLMGLGLGNIDGLEFLGKRDKHRATVARLEELSGGKDTTIGHWEIAGHVSSVPLPTFSDGFPAEIVKKLETAFGRGIICNKPYSGTAVIRDYGEEHIRSGKLIVYTSADSVLQIAAHKDIVDIETLYEYCRVARRIMSGEKYGVGRIIARPFDGEVGNFVRTAERKDFSIEPPKGLLPESVKSHGLESIAVGKISDIFAGRGFTRSIYTHSNEEGMAVCSKLLTTDFRGLCFVNLVDFDMLWGHRRDAVRYAEGLNAFDTWLGGFVDKMMPDDMLIITADHGCDPSYMATTDHTREYTPFIMYYHGINAEDLGTRRGFYNIAATVAEALGVDLECDGRAMI